MTNHGGGDQDSVARSIALRAASNDALIQKQTEFLDRQGLLQVQQLQSLQQDREHGVAELRNLKLKNLRDRLRIVMEVAIALVIVAIVGLLADVVFSAWNSKNVVMSAFDVPPALEAEGLSGKVVASALLDQLAQLQSQTRSSQKKRGVKDAWSGDIKVEIPEAHISIGELQRYLHEWLGDDVQIGGSLVRTASGIALTVRGTGFPAHTFEGKTDALPALLVQAAEYVYGQSETYLFANYLSSHGRDNDALALIKAAFGTALPSDKPLLLNVWGLALLDQSKFDEALARFREALRLKPDYWIAYSNIQSAQASLGQEEAEIQTGLQMERISRRGHWFAKDVREILFQNLDQERWDLRAAYRETLADIAANDGHGSTSEEGAPLDAQFLAQMHDVPAARLELETSPGAGKDPYVVTQTDYVNGLIALDRRDDAQALKSLLAVDAALAPSPDLATNFNAPSCWLALAEAREASVPATKVDADIARGGTFVDCYRFKADISDLRGDWARAQSQYAAAVALAPSIPSGYFSWREALLRHGDSGGAIAKFQEANTRGPHWADPLKSWGDALAVQKDFKGAVQHYELAEAYAPNWGQLHLHWAMALAQLGKNAAAKKQYQTALDDDLVEVDRAAANAGLNRL